MRKRLTARNVRAESRADGIFPGDIGNEEREKNYHDPEEYSNYDFQEGWDLPVSDNNWEEDKRDEVGFGIPKTANSFHTARQAAAMAQCFLGDDAPTEEIEKQARVFMKLGYRNIVASLRRWKATEPVPEAAGPETEECENCTLPVPPEQPEACQAGEDENIVPPAEQPEACKAGEEPVIPEETPEQPTACGNAETPDVEFNEVAAGEDESGDDEAPALQIDVPPACDDNASNMFATEGELNQAEPDPELVALFSGDSENDDEQVARVASKQTKKQGIKHLAGQPKLASSQESFGVKDLESIWSGIKLPGLF